MLKIRLTRKGKKNNAFFRLVVAEQASPIKGRFLENLGFYNPRTKERSFKDERIKYWIEKGAQCSDSVHNLLVKANVLKEPKRAIKIRKKRSGGGELQEGNAEKKTEEKAEGKKDEMADKKAEKKEEEKKKEVITENLPEKSEEKPEKAEEK